MKVVIVGGVAGGMSCAARLRRLDEAAEIVVFEKGREVSFANCGMPYHLSGVIGDRKALMLHTPTSLAKRYNLDVRVQQEVLSINRAKKTVRVKNLATGATEDHSYDKLVLSPGAPSFVPSLPGLDTARVFVLNTLQDMDSIRQAAEVAKRACVVGGGFIGIEVAENLRHRGLEVCLVEKAPQVMPPFDPEMARGLADELELNGVKLHLGVSVKALDGTNIILDDGRKLEADFVVFAIGVLPLSGLASEAGLELGHRNHIAVDQHLRTSDPDIYAVGDVVSTRDYLTRDPVVAPLAGPANRQGRIAADHICGLDSSYRDTQGTAIIKVFNLSAAATGLNEKWASQKGLKFQKVYLHPMQHPGYYPGAAPVSIKLMFQDDGRILGAQVVGSDGTDSLINVFATAIRGGLKVQDLEHLELAYSPQWGNAKHPINVTGFIASNLLRGEFKATQPEAIPAGALLLDVRTAEEQAAGTIPGSLHIPVDELRDREAEIPKGRPIVIYCAVGLRGYIAARHLAQHGYEVSNLVGGYRSWRAFFPDGMQRSYAFDSSTGKDLPGNRPLQASPPVTPTAPLAAGPHPSPTEIQLDACGLQCPGPIVKVKETMDALPLGGRLRVRASDPGFAKDIPAWAACTGNKLIEVKSEGGNYVALLEKTASVTPGANCRPKIPGKEAGTTMVVFSNDLDRALAAFIIANGSAAMGMPVTMFFTFWGLNILRRDNAVPVHKNLLERLFGFMMPRGPRKLVLSKMHMAGMGTAMMKGIMKSKRVSTLPELIEMAQKAGVRMVACSMSMDVMGIHREELVDGIEVAGVADYLGSASGSSTNLFI